MRNMSNVRLNREAAGVRCKGDRQSKPRSREARTNERPPVPHGFNSLNVSWRAEMATRRNLANARLVRNHDFRSAPGLKKHMRVKGLKRAKRVCRAETNRSVFADKRFRTKAPPRRKLETKIIRVGNASLGRNAVHGIPLREFLMAKPIRAVKANKRSKKRNKE